MLTNKLRLYIIYVLIGLAIVGAAIGVAAKFEAKDIALEMAEQENVITLQEAKIAQLREDNQRATAGLAEVAAAQKATDAILGSLQSDLAAIRIDRTSVYEKIEHLEKTNEQVRNLLDTRLPAGSCVLDNSCEGRVRPSAAGNHQTDPR